MFTANMHAGDAILRNAFSTKTAWGLDDLKGIPIGIDIYGNPIYWDWGGLKGEINDKKSYKRNNGKILQRK